MTRSLPLSLSGALLGIALAVADYRVDWKTALFLAMVIICGCKGVFYWEPECKPSQYKLGAFTEDGLLR